MPVHERRQHFRIEDQVYFDYKIITSGEVCSDKSITEELLGQNGKRYLETTQYFQSLDYELAELTQSLALQEPALAHYLNLINAKIDYLARHLLIGDKINLRKVNISLGGMSFKTKDRVKEKTHMQGSRYLVKDFGTSKSPKSTRQRAKYFGRDCPASGTLR